MVAIRQLMTGGENMNVGDELGRFLGGMSGTGDSALAHGSEVRRFPFVTISRQSGAGGHTLAETLIKVMDQEEDTALFKGWQLFDQKLCEKLADDYKLNMSMESLLSEEYRSQIEVFVQGLFSKLPDQNLTMRRMFEIIRSLATVGKVIIVGRGGSQVTHKLDLGVHVRLVAPEHIRVKRLAGLLGQSEEHAKQTMRKQDHDRVRLIKSFFAADIDDPLLYDAVWNTGTVSVEAIAEAVVSIIKHRVAERHPAPVNIG
ncbi:MAG: cytidylate kinase-like family protein [Candidatus Competibacteraceae bacterium]|jgi:cytidylate kinase|nr:cytidylate kinase-like family protein [Candidatus Competibacteraceae bacterium]